jgi:hypothetical protein
VEIRDSKYCIYDSNGTSQYGIGVTDGHRCCSKLASDALSGQSTIADRLREAEEALNDMMCQCPDPNEGGVGQCDRCAYLAKWKERG